MSLLIHVFIVNCLCFFFGHNTHVINTIQVPLNNQIVCNTSTSKVNTVKTYVFFTLFFNKKDPQIMGVKNTQV